MTRSGESEATVALLSQGRQGSWRNTSDRKRCVRAVRREPIRWRCAGASAGGTREAGVPQQWEVPLASQRSVRTTGTRRADLCSDIVSYIALSLPLPLSLECNKLSGLLSTQTSTPISCIERKDSCDILNSFTFCFRAVKIAYNELVDKYCKRHEVTL